MPKSLISPTFGRTPALGYGQNSKRGLDPESTHKTGPENGFNSEGEELCDTWQYKGVFKLFSHVVPPKYWE